MSSRNEDTNMKSEFVTDDTIFVSQLSLMKKDHCTWYVVMRVQQTHIMNCTDACLQPHIDVY